MHDIKIEEASFFPKPNSYFKEVPQYEKLSNGVGRAWEFNGLFVIASCGIMNDSLEWLHISFSRKSKMPSYADLQLVKKEFIGNDKKAIMIFPVVEYYVNIHKNCLHLWYSKDNPIPEFSEGGTI